MLRNVSSMRVRFPCPGSGESVNGGCFSYVDDPDGSCDVDGQHYVSAVALHRTGSDQTFNKVVSIVCISLGGPGYETGSVTDASGDVVVMSSECREVDKGTLDKIRMCKINLWSELKMHYEPYHSVIFREGVFVISREQPLFADYADTIGNRRELV